MTLKSFGQVQYHTVLITVTYNMNQVNAFHNGILWKLLQKFCKSIIKVYFKNKRFNYKNFNQESCLNVFYRMSI